MGTVAGGGQGHRSFLKIGDVPSLNVLVCWCHWPSGGGADRRRLRAEGILQEESPGVESRAQARVGAAGSFSNKIIALQCL